MYPETVEPTLMDRRHIRLFRGLSFSIHRSVRNISEHRDRTNTVQILVCRQVVDSRNVDHDRDVVVGARRERRLQGAETDHVQVSQKDDFKDEAEASMEVMIILKDDRVKNPEMINIMSAGSAVESSESAL